MTIVVADTGPIHYLILIDAIETLPTLFDRIILPGSVARNSGITMRLDRFKIGHARCRFGLR